MKGHYRKLVALALFVLALNIAALSQDFGPKVRAQIPFSFYAGGKKLPAGIYTLAVNRENCNVAIFQRNTGVGAFLLGSPHDGSSDGRSVLVFVADGEGTYVLEKIEERELGISFPTGKLISHVAMDRPANETQVVVAELVR